MRGAFRHSFVMVSQSFVVNQSNSLVIRSFRFKQYQTRYLVVKGVDDDCHVVLKVVLLCDVVP